jgi:hypothetical protein
MEREELKQYIINFYKRNESSGKAFTVKYFENLGYTESTVRYYLKKFERGLLVPTPEPFSNATNQLLTPKSGRIVKRTSSKTPNTSRSLHLFDYENASPISKGEQMLETCKQRCKTLLRKYEGFDWVLVNRVAFSFKNNQGSHANPRYICFGNYSPPPVDRSVFIPKLEVWVAFSNKGISEPFIQSISEKFDYNVYLEECVKKRLIPFIKEKHINLANTVVWADAQPAYTNKKVLAHLDENSIIHVDKEENPGNRVKCFSYFWNYLRNTRIYARNWEAENEDELADRIKYCLKSLDMNGVKRIVNDTEKRLNEMALNGELVEWHDNKQKYTE